MECPFANQFLFPYNSHTVVVLLHTFESNFKPISYFYRLIPLGKSDSGRSTLEAVWSYIEADNLEQLLKSQLVMVISDGAGKYLIC